MSEAEYIKLIPLEELKVINTFLREVYDRRDFTTSNFSMKQAWEHVISLMQTAEGGCWHDRLEAHSISCAMLEQVGRAIDRFFFGNELHRKFRRLCGKDLGYKVIDYCSYDKSWIAFFSDDNVIHYNTSKWSKCIDPGNPIECEGIVCTSRLEVLVHTIGHELVHALLFHLFPKIDKASAAYHANQRHGPVFQLLNKKLFGHSVDSYRPFPASSSYLAKLPSGNCSQGASSYLGATAAESIEFEVQILG